MRTIRFKAPSGAKLAFSELGLGSAPIGNLYAAVPKRQATATLEAAWNAGIRYFDTAPLYGLGLAETRLNMGASTPDQIALNSRTLSAKIPKALWADLQASGYIRKDAPVSA
jgi:diketogulonate reductase-like aldo/keto reductase